MITSRVQTHLWSAGPPPPALSFATGGGEEGPLEEEEESAGTAMEVEDEEDFIAPFSPDFKDATEAFEKKKSFHPPLSPPPPAAIATPPSTLRLSVAGAAP